MSSLNHIPSFDEPESDNLFLGSSFGLHTYSDLKKFKNFFLQFLFDYDHDFEKPVGFLAHSSDTLIFAIAACWNLGIPFIPLNPKAPFEELRKQLDNIELGLLFIDIDSECQSEINHQNKIDIMEVDIPDALCLDIELSESARNYQPNNNPDHVFGYFFTSGTSGTPKIVPLKRKQMLFAAKASARNFKPRVNHFWLLCLPLNHIGGISIILRSLLYGSSIFRVKSFHPKMMNTFLSENKLFQVASLVPTMLKRLLDKADFCVHKDFKAILLGGGPIDQDLVQQAIERGIPLVPSYGMTETCAQIAANSILEPSGTYCPRKSVGEIFSANAIQIRGEQGNVLGPNNSGEVWIKGPQVFDGYLNREKALDFDSDEWFNTGDFGHLNINKQLFIESRRGDLIITGGENVSPFEVETELKKIDSIFEAAVLALPDKQWGQRVAAVIVTENQKTINIEKIQIELKERLAAFKIPKQIIQTKKLPQTETGKVQRNKLVRLFNER